MGCRLRVVGDGGFFILGCHDLDKSGDLLTASGPDSLDKFMDLGTGKAISQSNVLMVFISSR